MPALRDLYMELRKKKKYTLKQIADSVGIAVYVLKGAIYQGTRPQGKNIHEHLRKYFEKELGRPISEITFESGRGKKARLIDRVKELISQMGETKITKVFNDIVQKTSLSIGTLEKWCYLNVLPKKVDKLKELAEYFTKKLGREVTVNYLLGKEPLKEPIEPVKEESLEDIVNHLELALSALKRAQFVAVDNQQKQILEIFRKLPPVEKENALSFLKFKLTSAQL